MPKLEARKNMPSIIQLPELELKALPKHFKYAFLGESITLLVIISTGIKVVEKSEDS